MSLYGTVSNNQRMRILAIRIMAQDGLVRPNGRVAINTFFASRITRLVVRTGERARHALMIGVAGFLAVAEVAVVAITISIALMNEWAIDGFRGIEHLR